MVEAMVFFGLAVLAGAFFAAVKREESSSDGLFAGFVLVVFVLVVLIVFGASSLYLNAKEDAAGSLACIDSISAGETCQVLGAPVRTDEQYLCFLRRQDGKVRAVSLKEEPPVGRSIVCVEREGKKILLAIEPEGSAMEKAPASAEKPLTTQK